MQFIPTNHNAHTLLTPFPSIVNYQTPVDSAIFISVAIRARWPRPHGQSASRIRQSRETLPENQVTATVRRMLAPVKKGRQNACPHPPFSLRPVVFGLPLSGAPIVLQAVKSALHIIFYIYCPPPRWCSASPSMNQDRILYSSLFTLAWKLHTWLAIVPTILSFSFLRVLLYY
jgi:hypothetical protein